MTMNKMSQLRFSYFVLLLCAVSLPGCSDSASQRSATVQGTLTIDGELASSGTVTFYPVDGGPVAVGQVQSDGSYSLSTGRGTAVGPNSGTVFPGTYQVAVMVMGRQDDSVVIGDDGPPAAGPRLVAKKYTNNETSGLEFEIKPGRNLFVLQVLGVSHDPPADDATAENGEENGEENASDAEATSTDEAASTEDTEKKQGVIEPPAAKEKPAAKQSPSNEKEARETPSERDANGKSSDDPPSEDRDTSSNDSEAS